MLIESVKEIKGHNEGLSCNSKLITLPSPASPTFYSFLKHRIRYAEHEHRFNRFRFALLL